VADGRDAAVLDEDVGPVVVGGGYDPPILDEHAHSYLPSVMASRKR
jgi:hypothetical protein